MFYTTQKDNDMEELKEKCFFILDFFESRKIGSPFIEMQRDIILMGYENKNKVGLQYALRDLLEGIRHLSPKERKLFTIKAFKSNLKFKYKVRQKLEIIEHVLMLRVISNNFEYELMKEFYHDLKLSNHLSEDTKKDILEVISSYDYELDN